MESMNSDKEFSEGLVSWGLFAIVIALIGMMTTGCSSATGWQVGFGVYPVTQIRNVQSLQATQAETRTIKRAPAPKTGPTAEDDY